MIRQLVYPSARHAIFSHAIALAVASAACGEKGDDETSSVVLEEKVEALAALPTVPLQRTNQQVPVCFLEGLAVDRQNVRFAIESTWERYSRLDFTGWGDCPASPSSATVPVRLQGGGGAGGVAKFGVGGRFPDGAQVKVFFGDSRAFMLSNAVHEFGHALGFPHEQQRNDQTTCFAAANADSQWAIIPDLYRMSPYDPNSIMNYCRDIDRDGFDDINGAGETEDNFDLSNMDKAGVALLYGRPVGRTTDAAFAWVPGGSWSSPRALDKTSAWNSAGSFAEGSASQTGTGTYSVDFYDLGVSAGGNFQVTAPDRGRCAITGWSPAGAAMRVGVACVGANGTPMNTGFSVSYVRRYTVANAYRFAEGGYLWYGGSNTLDSTYSWNSLGQTNTVTRTAVGRYTAVFNGQAPFGLSDGTAEVTAYGQAATTCKIGDQRVSGANAVVDVLCFAGANAADSNFSLRYGRHITGGTPSGAYAWANNASATVLYNPPIGRGKVSISRGDGTHSAPDNAITIERLGTGSYSVRFNGLPASTDVRYLYMKSNAHVTAYGTDSRYCTFGPQGWQGINNTDAFVTVTCYTASGAAADSRFNVTFSSTFSTVGPVVALKWNQKYVMANEAGASPLIATADAVGEWERFALISNPDSTVSLFALVNNRYVTAENAGNSPLIARGTEIREWESFRSVKNADGTISFVANINGKYVCTENGASPLIANRTAIGDWEKFRIEVVEP